MKPKARVFEITIWINLFNWSFVFAERNVNLSPTCCLLAAYNTEFSFVFVSYSLRFEFWGSALRSKMAEHRFWQPKTVEEEERYDVNAIPTWRRRYQNKWALRIFEVWREGRFPKEATLEPGVFFFFLKNMIYAKFSRWKFLYSSNGCFKC